MYQTCLYCHAGLGANQQVEAFPVGQRLAFDPALGRLWVVCPHCGRWNLSALEERWEAIEECERLYRGTLRRVATENIGLAQLPSSLALVRIGAPLRPEMAAWRYGGALLRRRRHDLMGGVAAMGVVGGGAVTTVGGIAAAAMLGGAAFAVAAAGVMPIALGAGAVAWYRRRDAVPVQRATDGALVRVRHLPSLSLQGDDQSLTVRVDSDHGLVELAGEPAHQLAALACARRNQIGARASYVQTAVDRLEASGGAEGTLRLAIRAGELSRIRYMDRLALEMALNEAAERRAMEGELAALEEAWRSAEEIAAIADSLVTTPLEGLRRRLRGTNPNES